MMSGLKCIVLVGVPVVRQLYSMSVDSKSFISTLFEELPKSGFVPLNIVLVDHN